MFIRVNGIKMYYRVSGSGPALVMIHGNGEECSVFDPLAKALSAHFTVYQCDSRGHGKSSPVTEFHYADMAEDFACFIRELGLEKPFIYGFSDGGILALLMAIRHPGLLGGMAASGANTTPNGLRTVSRMKMRLKYLRTKSARHKLMLTEPHITKAELGTIRIPTLITAGDDDLIREADTRFIADCIPNAQLRIYKGETHTSYVLDNDFLAPVLLDFAKENGLAE